MFADVDAGDTLIYTSDATDWLSFDPATRTFSGTPLNTHVGTTSVTVTATDSSGEFITDSFDIVVANSNDAPTVANAMADQSANEDSPFSFQFANNVFADVDASDTLTYTSDATDWLSFDPATRTFTGTPLNNHVGTTSVTVTATDSSGAFITDSFDIVVANSNDTPTVANAMADQSASEDSPFSFQFADNVFADVDAGDTLIYTSDATDWLSFDPATRTFSGTPLNTHVGTTSVTVTATDSSGEFITDSFDIVVANSNDAPTVANAMADQSANEDSPFSFQFANNVFADVDASDTLTYTSDATDWLSFDPATRTFTGTPLNNHVGTTSVTVTATDSSGAFITDSFDIVVANSNDTPTVANAMADQSASEDSPFSFQFADNVFADVDAGDTLIYTSDATDWLSFDPATRTFSGTPLNTHVGTTSVTVTATDSSGEFITDSFDIVVANSNDAPTVANAMTDQSANEDSPFSFQFANNVFADVDAGDTLTYTSDATDWLSFDPVTRTFSGTPLNTHVGTTSVTVTATDSSGELITDSFDIVIANSNDAPTVANAMADQSASEDSPFSFQFANNVFADVDAGDTLIYTSDATDWLSFDPATRTFSGTPLNTHVGTTSVTVTATDSSGELITDSFDIVIANSNDAPTLANAMADQSASEDSPFSFQFANNVFADVDAGDTLTYTSDATDWLSFDPVTRTFSGTPLNTHVGTTSVTVTATDGNGSNISNSFNIIISSSSNNNDDDNNQSPILVHEIKDLNTTAESFFSFAFPSNTFVDPNTSTNDHLTYTATLSDGLVLPNWLKFDAANRTFSGAPNNSDVGSISINLSANNGSGSSSTDFILTVINAPATITITGVDTGVVTTNTPLTTGELIISDHSNFIAETIYGTYGKFTIEESGIWSYSLYSTQDELQQLAQGENLNAIFQVVTTNGFTHDIVISINETSDSAPYFYTNITMTTQTENIATISTFTAAEKPNATANKFVSNLNDEISQMLEELNSVSLDSTDNSSLFDSPEYELDSYSTDYDEDKSESEKSSQKQNQNQGLNNKLSSQRENLTIGKANIDENEDQALWNRIDNIRDQIDDDATSDNEKLDVKIVLGTSIGLTAGVVSWFLRGGALLASLMSSIPFLNRFDPVPILKSKEKKPVEKASRKVR